MIRQHHNRKAFSLVELVIVTVIIGIISAIAVPRISHAARRTKVNALQASVGNVRKAIDRYFAEHNRFPGYNPTNGVTNGAFFMDQLMKFSDFAGHVSDTKTSVFRFGPYLRRPFPRNPINDKDKVFVKATSAEADPSFTANGWIAVLSTGDFGLSASAADVDDLIDTTTPSVLDAKSRIMLK